MGRVGRGFQIPGTATTHPTGHQEGVPADAVKVLIVGSHPVQYNSPVFRLYAQDRRLSVTVAYCSLHGVVQGHDPYFGMDVAWDVPLLDGYRWLQMRNWSTAMSAERLLGLVNPGLWKLIWLGRFDVVVVHGYRTMSFLIAAVAARSCGSAVALTNDAHTLTATDGKAWKTRLKAALIPGLVGAFDGVIVPSTAAARFAIGLGVPAKAVYLVPYVVDNDFFRERAGHVDRAEARARWGIAEAATVALFCGKMYPQKRPLDLLLAAAPLENVHTVFVGDGVLRTELERRARALGIASRTHFAGFVNQTGLPAIYRTADVLVLPSAHEAFGLVVNEAFACGIPAIVSSACGSAGDLVQDGRTGYIVPVGDVETLSARLQTLALNADLRETMGRQAARLVQDWGPSQHAAAFADACLSLAAMKKRRSERCSDPPSKRKSVF